MRYPNTYAVSPEPPLSAYTYSVYKRRSAKTNHKGCVTSLDPDQPGHPLCTVRQVVTDGCKKLLTNPSKR